MWGTPRGRRRLLAAGLVLGVLVGAVFVSPARAVALVTGLPDAAFLGALVALYLLRPFLGVPLSPFSVLIGFRYGLPGVGLALAGTLLTSLPPYLAGGYLRGDDGVFDRLAGLGERAIATVGDLRGVVAARLSPAPADAVSYAAGVSGVPARAYVLGTLLGEIPWATGFVALGASLETLAVTGLAPDPALVAASALLAALLVGLPLARRLRG